VAKVDFKQGLPIRQTPNMGGSQSVDTTFDVVVVGAGVAGLLSAVRLSKQYKVLVLEQRARLGGRARVADFCGAKVLVGAGVLRAHKDKLMQGLLKEFGVKYETTSVASKPNLGELYDELCAAKPSEHETFEAFGRRVLAKRFNVFVQQMGFTDMLRASAVETMRCYGLEDNICAYKAVKFDWNVLVAELARKARLQGATILTNHKAVKLSPIGRRNSTNPNPSQNVGSQDKTKPGIQLRVISGATSRPTFVRARKVVIASTKACIKALLPQSTCFEHLHAQPFIRVYAQMDAQSSLQVAAKINNFKVVSNCLMKISKVASPGNDVFMVGYADNQAAEALKAILDAPGSRTELAKLVCQALNLPSINILDVRAFYHKEGTHYYDEQADLNNTAQYTPLPNVYVVGEAVSHNQGWTEGAVKTVNLVVNNILSSY
jgi:hypothetical protein